MTTFGWKRKAGDNIDKSAASKFKEATGHQESDRDEDEAHWIKVAKQQKVIQLEDATTKSKRLKEEGCILAEADRYWEAIKKWDEALQLTPDNERILDMKAQTLMILHELFPAVQAAELAVSFNSRWWVAHQTLGRAQLDLGEIELAIISFSKALHLNPTEAELWEEDLRWACSLLQEKQTMGSENQGAKHPVKNADGQEATAQRTGQEIDGKDAAQGQLEECAAPVDAPVSVQMRVPTDSDIIRTGDEGDGMESSQDQLEECATPVDAPVSVQMRDPMESDIIRTGDGMESSQDQLEECAPTVDAPVPVQMSFIEKDS